MGVFGAMALAVAAGVSAAAEVVSPAVPPGGAGKMACASFAEVGVRGELRERLERNYSRLHDERYSPDKVFISPADSSSGDDWPGDTEGRTILALVLESQATGRESAHLAEIMRRVPGWLNARGYMGPVHDDFIDEQQLSGNGWMLRALCEYAAWKGDASADLLAGRMAKSLFAPWKGEFARYPIDPAGRVKGVGAASGTAASRIGKWRLSTDVGCVFIGMAGLAQVYERQKDESLRPLLDEMVARFLEMDLVSIRAQTHASLTAMLGVLRYADASGRGDLVSEVVRRFAVYREKGMTESYANYNWFCRYDSWTEPCAIVDSYILAVELWRRTLDAAYLELADRIYLNALCRAQRRNGGFGLENCPGAAAKTDCLSVHVPEAHWCCSMRGGEGLSRAVQYAAFHRRDDVYLAFFRDARVRVGLSGGRFEFDEACSVPLGNAVRLKVAANEAGRVALHFRQGDWMVSPRVSVNGRAVEASSEGGFLVVSGSFGAGDEIVFSFDRRRRWQPALNAENAPAKRRAFYGPLLLGGAEDADALDSLAPVYEAFRAETWEKGSGRVRILFD